MPLTIGRVAQRRARKASPGSCPANSRASCEPCRRAAVAKLPAGLPVDVHFRKKPRYNPWDQRILPHDADGDLFEAISAGRVELTTDHVDHFDATGIMLASGRHPDADIVVTATGLQLQALGGVSIGIDGEEIKPSGPVRL